MLEDEIDEKYYLSNKAINYILDGDNVALNSGRDINDRVVNPQIAKTISCRGATNQRADVTNFVIDGCGEETKVKELKLKIKKQCCQEDKFVADGKKYERINNWGKRNVETNNIIPTLDTKCDCLGVTVNQPPLRIRKLTPKECWRLMGFDDEDFEKAEKVNSNAQLYKQSGNSIVVNVLEALLTELFKEEIK